MKQVFLNLVLNASQAIPKGGAVTVSSNRVNKGRIAVHIADTGVGIPKDQQSRIFDPFYSTKKRGTGLGLPIARRIVEEHGGQIGLQSEPGTGTTFTVELPSDKVSHFHMPPGGLGHPLRTDCIYKEMRKRASGEASPGARFVYGHGGYGFCVCRGSREYTRKITE